jgi:hypothetical protein
MKNTVLKTAVFFTCILFSSIVLSQDIALSNSIKPYANYYNFSSKVVIKMVCTCMSTKKEKLM